MNVCIKTGQPAGVPELWGDFWFAYALKRSLVGLGHRVGVLGRERLTQPAAVEIVLLGLDMAWYEPPPETLSIAWLISHPEQNTGDVLRRYSYAYVSSRLLADRWGHEYMPQASDRAAHYPPSDVDEHPAFDVAFVGNGRPGARRQLVAAMNREIDRFHVWGSFHPRAVRNLHRPVPGTRSGEVYRSAAVVLGQSRSHARAAGIAGDRLYAATACRAFFLSDRIAGIEVDLPELVTYDGVDEAVELCLRYLGDPAERRRVAARCCERTSDDHFDDRAARIAARIDALAS